MLATQYKQNSSLIFVITNILLNSVLKAGHILETGFYR